MIRLLHDRYYAYAAEHAWDLATGESVTIDTIAMAPSVAAPVVEPLAEVLDHGRDGEPRWVVVETAAGPSSLAVARRVAEDARARGFVPIAVDVYLRLRSLLEEELRHRTLMLILPPGAALEQARQAIVVAAAASPRPHVLVSFRSNRVALYLAGSRPPRSGRDPGALASAHLVREARAVYGAGAQVRPAFETLPDDVIKHMARGSRWVDLWRAGRHAAAERLLRDVAGALQRRRALVPAASALVTLGRLMLERGRASDADAIFGEAATHAQAAKQEPLSATARVWQAAARTDAAQLTAAESLCRAAIVAGSLAGGERARGEATLARTLLWQGRVSEAAARDLRIETDDPELGAFVAATSIRVSIANGDLFAAGQRARELLTLADGAGHVLVRVIAFSAHLRVLIEAGDLALAEKLLADLQGSFHTSKVWSKRRGLLRES